MSHSFDAMRDALIYLEGDAEIKTNLKLMIDALHAINHETKDALNFDDRVRKPATKISKRIKYLIDTAYDDA